MPCILFAGLGQTALLAWLCHGQQVMFCTTSEWKIGLTDLDRLLLMLGHGPALPKLLLLLPVETEVCNTS